MKAPVEEVSLPAWIVALPMNERVAVLTNALEEDPSKGYELLHELILATREFAGSDDVGAIAAFRSQIGQLARGLEKFETERPDVIAGYQAMLGVASDLLARERTRALTRASHERREEQFSEAVLRVRAALDAGWNDTPRALAEALDLDPATFSRALNKIREQDDINPNS